MAKLIINAQGKALVNGQGKAYAVANMDAAAGQSPIAVTAAAGKVLRLMRYGKCSQASTPTPSSPVDILFNNGAAGREKLLTIDSTRITAYINDAGVWRSSGDSYSVKIPVTVGKRYRIKWTTTDSSVVGTIFRYGFTNDATPSTTNYLSQWLRSTPQAWPEVEIVADANYLIVQNGASVMAGNISNGRIKVYESLPREFIMGKNLLDKNDITALEFLTTTGKASVTSTPSLAHTGYIRVKPSTTYTISGCGGVSGATNVRVCEYSIANEGGFKAFTNGATANEVVTFTTGADTQFVRINLRTYDTSPMLEEGSTNTAYQPYFAMSVPDLLGIGDYKDEADIISGKVTRRVGVKVLDGTENWTSGTLVNGTILRSYISGGIDTGTVIRQPMLSSHFVFDSSKNLAGVGFVAGAGQLMFEVAIDLASTKDEWKAWLASQYAAGTPVVAIYPTADSTEQVARQPLQTGAGTNKFSSSYAGAEMKVIYKVQ